MKYNSKYDRYVDDDLVIYRWDENKDKLVQCNQHITSNGYVQMRTKISQNYVHRIIWETFYGEIPEGYQIDHINTIRDDNRLENLRLVSCKENHNNPLTIEHKLSALKIIWKSNKRRKSWNNGLKGSEYKKHFKNGFKNQFSYK